MTPSLVPVPTRMRHLPRDPRGYPVFFMAYVDGDGDPHFTINEETRRQTCIVDGRCSICGGQLNRGRWFIGGPLSAFDERGCYLDPPMHAECLHYALRVCPYLALPKWSRYIEGKSLKVTDPTPTVMDPAVDDRRPEVFVALMATGQRHIKGIVADGGVGIEFVQYVKPHRPYSRIEFWRHGRELDYDAAIAAMPDDHVQALGGYIEKHGPIR